MDHPLLDNRLSAVVRWVLPGEIMADIGTDHAYLPSWLILNGCCPLAIAADVAAGPYHRAADTVAAYGLGDKISVRLGPGLSVLRPGEAATVVLAGMGGQLICRLLSERPDILATVRRLVLQPQRNPELVRAWLAENGWRIIADDVARDGKMWYNIIAAEPGAMELDESAILYGPMTPGVSPDLRRQWLEFRRDALLAIVRRLRDGSRRSLARAAEAEREAGILDKLISEVSEC